MDFPNLLLSKEITEVMGDNGTEESACSPIKASTLDQSVLRWL